MKIDSFEEVRFFVVCLMLLASVESFNWTVQPTNPTLVTKGEEVSLTWDYSLTADEHSKSLNFYGITWKKLNQSTFNYDKIGDKGFAKFFGTVSYAEPFAPRIVIDRNKPATLLIKTIKSEDEGTYTIEYGLDSTGTTITARHEVNVTVQEPSKIVSVSSYQDVCEHSDVTLSCNATGKPAPNITWTRVWENGTDRGRLQSVDGYFVIHNVSRSSYGTYRCTAFNGVGERVNQTTTVFVRYSPSVDSVVRSPNTAIEGHPYNLTCNVSGDPLPHISWIKVSNDKCTVGRLLQFDNISRNDAGDYKCVASNRCGNDSKTETINVLYDPAYVTLETNATENKGCFDLWVNFNCTSSKANPPVYNYLLLKNGTEFKSNKSGTWIEKISEGGKAIYSCIANQSVENVLSENITIIVNVPTSVRKAKRVAVNEGDDVQESCLNITGFPYPTVIWEKNGNPIADGNLLNFTKISRDKTGDYRCTANNTCGTDATMVYIDVQYEPENVKLSSNTTRKEVCAGIFINFTCTANANPPVHTYLLYENDTKVNGSLGNTGIWISKLETGGNIVFRCTANNSIQETRESNDTVFFVKVPPSVKQTKIEPVKEGDTVEMYCNATGSPNPTVSWTKGENGVSDNSSLIIENISRNEAGDYKCTANNTCGNASTMVYVDVQYKPENVELISNPSSKEVCAGIFVNLTCTADANPPVHTYLLYENDVVIQGPNNTGIWLRRLDKGGNFTYRCKVNNSFPGIEESNNLTFTVRVPPSLRQASKKSAVEGSHIKVYCNATGIPNPTVWWTKDNNVVSNTSLLTFPNISRDKAGEYQCIASNACENTSAMVCIDVEYEPVWNGSTEVTAIENKPFDLVCPITGNPTPEYNWVSNDGKRTKTGKTWVFQRMESSYGGSYTCTAKNYVGEETVMVSLRVVAVEMTHHIQASINKNENDASKRNSTCKTFAKVACSVLPNCVDNEVTDCGPGKIVIDLKFSTDVTVNQVISNLTKAVDQGKFGSLAVDTSSLKSLSPSSSTTATEPTSTMVTKVPECEEAIFKKKNCETKWVNVSVTIVASVVVIGVVVVSTWFLHKKRKCRKHTKVKNSDGQPLSSNHSTLSDSNPFAKDNCGYHKSGPQPTVEIENEQSVEAMGGEPIPAYAMVDKSKKKDKKKNREAAEQKLTEDQYAVVDKSKKKKKKKNEQDNTYAEVDMSRTSKKKQKPGEVFYADLDEFQQMQKMPKVSTSPEPLPPIKRPEAYGETQYADITQFLKGNPDTGAVLPKDSTTAAVRNTATGSKEESSAGNTGDHSEATNETGF